VCELLRQLAARHLGLPITLVLDNARYQKCQLVEALAASLQIELLYLPAYSPNLNLIERLWKFVKKTCLYWVRFKVMQRRVDRFQRLLFRPVANRSPIRG